MSKYDRIRETILDLPPKSAKLVFEFINKLWENNLSKDYFDKHFWDFNVGVQSCICFYLEHYFTGSKKYSFFQFLEEKRSDYADAGEESDFPVYEETILKNRDELITKILNVYQATAKRRFRMLKHHQIPFWQFSKYFNHHVFDCKIPLYSDVEQFKTVVSEIFEGILSKQDLKFFFYNSFDFPTNLYHSQLLYIEVEDKKQVRQCMRQIMEHYNTTYKDDLESEIRKYNKAVDQRNISKIRKQFTHRFPEFEAVQPTREDFARITYNAFPIIRDNQKPDQNREDFIDSWLSNFVKGR